MFCPPSIRNDRIGQKGQRNQAKRSNMIWSLRVYCLRIWSWSSRLQHKPFTCISIGPSVASKEAFYGVFHQQSRQHHWMTWTVLHLRIENRLAQVALSRFRLHTGAALQNFVVPQRLISISLGYILIYFRDQQSVSYSFLESRIYRPCCNESSPNHESNQFNHSILVRWQA